MGAGPTYFNEEQFQTLINRANANQKQSYTEQGWANIAGLGSTFSNLAGSLIDYSALRTDAANLYVSAGQVELQAKQRANQLREQFIQSAGAYMMGAANRGISVQSGSVQANLERSSENLGKDIQTMEKNAALQARAYITQAKIAETKAKAQKRVAIAGAISSGVQNVGSAFYNFGQAGSIK